MSSWAIVALVAIVIWGIVQTVRARAGIVTDEDGNQKLAAPGDAGSRAELEATRRELESLRERVKVLERIATDANTGDAREQARIAAEIEALRGLPAGKKEEPGQ
jgi:cell division protein FtsB